MPILKQRCRDKFLQDWSMPVNDISKLSYHKRFQKDFGIEEYLDFNKNDQLISFGIPFQINPHNVEIKIERYTNRSRYSHYWKTCNQNVIESKL